MQQFAREAFVRVVRELTAAKIPVLAVKGIALAETLYASDVRFMVDVDLRVVPEDLARAEAIARARGWRVAHRSKQMGTFEIDLGMDGPLVEVESTIGPPGVCKIDVRTMLSRGTVHDRDRLHWLEPELHDHALLLCINVFKDKLVHARPWAREDLLRVGDLDGFSPRTIVERAHEADLRELVAIVSAWLVESPRWQEVAALLESGPRRRMYAGLFATLVRRRPESRALAIVARAVSDDPWMRVRALASGAVGTARFHLRRGE
nr:hypothetical protein Hi04_10k_c3883_00007 [uncultured bacterium]